MLSGRPLRAVHHPLFGRHEPWRPHVEDSSRYRAVARAVSAAEAALGDQLTVAAPHLATRDDLLRLHTAGYVDRVLALMGEQAALDHETLLSEDSVEAALAGAGSCIEAAEAIMAAEVDRVVVLPRPPGHHAEADRAMGFCVFGNAALAAEAALRAGAGRVLVVDFDVHHGNGTEALLAHLPAAGTVSFHSERLFPHDTGDESSDSARAIWNRPLGARADGEELLRAVARFLDREGAAFDPELLIVAAGFDGHADDAMSEWQVSTEEYAVLLTLLRDFAERHCAGRMLVTLEGGYDPVALEDCVLAMLRVLA
jgi:acetoin utilization deacetylase AcuC-like enzyme